eukprot:1284798-Pyramimonas_sp.AAC.1
MAKVWVSLRLTGVLRGRRPFTPRVIYGQGLGVRCDHGFYGGMPPQAGGGGEKRPLSTGRCESIPVAGTNRRRGERIYP